LPAALSAAALALDAAGKVSAALAEATLRAAVRVAAGRGAVAGVASAEVVALVEGVNKSIFSGKVQLVTAVLLAVCLAAGAAGVLRLRAAAADPPASPPGPKGKEARGNRPPGKLPEPAAERAVEVRGRVLGPGGEPVAGARLYLSGPARSEQARSGPDGRFRFAAPRSEGPSVQVMAVAEGHGCDWVPVGGAGEELTLRLVKDVPVRGRILDPDGTPVAGARLTVTAVSAPKNEDLGEYVEAVRKGGDYVFASDWAGPLPGRPGVLTTGADGRFTLAGVGRERVVRFYLEGPSLASTYLDVMTRKAENITGHGRQLYGAVFDYLAEPSRPIRGVVRDKDTGKPLAGMSVRSWSNPRCQALTNQEGRYELLGLAKAPRYWLAVRPPDGLYFQRQAGVEDTPGLGALTGDIDMVRGLTVRGKVMDTHGKPVAGARVAYQPLYPNPNVNAKLPGSWVPRAEAVAGPDGSYALTVLPGPGVLGVTGPRPEAYMPAWVTLQERKDFFKGAVANPPHEIVLNVDGGGNLRGAISQDDYNALVLLNPAEKGEALVKNVKLEPGQVVKGRVVGPDGRPVAGVTVFGVVRLFGKETLKGAEFAVRLNPRGVSRPLVFHHKGRNLGCFVKDLRGAGPGPLTVTLRPCGSASGRVVDQDGQPVAGLRVQVTGLGLNSTAEARVAITDKDGRFRADGLVPGRAYHLTQAGPLTTLATGVLVEPGQRKDLGDIPFKPSQD
jgi:protocatechuate 3,4-dioxygenase beta subunit